MQLPKADDWRAFLLAARENGVTRLRVTPSTIEADLAPATPPSLVDAINKAAPLPEDPISIVRGTVRPTGAAELPDILEAMSEGGHIVETITPDPTAPQ